MAVSYTHLDVYKRQVVAVLEKFQYTQSIYNFTDIFFNQLPCMLLFYEVLSVSTVKGPIPNFDTNVTTVSRIAQYG